MGPKARTIKFYSGVSDRIEVVKLISRLFSTDGGPGSGNHDHDGRPGKVGGSAPSEDASNAEKLRERISKMSRFGDSGKLRDELVKQLESLEPKKEKPKKVERPRAIFEVAEFQSFPVTDHKKAQFEIIQETNPMRDDIHTGIRKPENIRSAEEALNPEDDTNEFVYPDFTKEDAQVALKTGKITIYSSYPIQNGVFVSPSRMMAGDYAGNGEVYSKEVPVDAVAWINSNEGQFADVKQTKANDGGEGSGNHNHAGRPGKVGGSAPSDSSSEPSPKMKESSTEYEGLQEVKLDPNFDIFSLMAEEAERLKKEQEAGFVESAKKSREALANTYHMKGLVDAAKAAKGDYRAFVKGMSALQKEALREQYNLTGSKEHFTDYVKRMQVMLANEEDIPDPTNKPVDGKDISKTYEYKGHEMGGVGSERVDTVIEDVIHQQGFDGLPKVVSKEEFDTITKDHPEMPLLYRSFTAVDADTLADYNDQLENGFWYVDCGIGGAQYGRGMYTAGVYTQEPVTLDNAHEAFNRNFKDFLVDDKGNYWDMGTPQSIDEVDLDKWLVPDQTYLFSDSGSKGYLLELVDMSDEGYDMQWIDRTTGDIHDFDWIKEKGFTEFRECDPTTKEESYKRDLRGAMEEMRHYRRGEEHASTREMTLDPSAKIIDYSDAVDIMDGKLTKAERRAYYEKELEKFREEQDRKYGKEDSPEKFIIEYALRGSLDKLDPDDWKKYNEACKQVDEETREHLLDKGHNEGRRIYGKIQLDTQEIRRERRKTMEKFYGDVGACMAALGYDAINANGHGATDSYTVVLNRTKLILSDQEVNPYI